jgi:hypothetical protein
VINPLTEKLRPYVPALTADYNAGGKAAAAVIAMYWLYQACPDDAFAYICCEDLFEKWRVLYARGDRDLGSVEGHAADTGSSERPRE